jgi:hypothetical protein
MQPRDHKKLLQRMSAIPPKADMVESENFTTFYRPWLQAPGSTNRVARRLQAGHLLCIKATEALMNFRIRGLEARQFDHLFALSDGELAGHGAVRQIADGPRPCRISLSDAKPGDELILLNYEHHAVSSPYRMRFAIYIRRGEETFDAIGEVPEQLRKRTLAVRGFDASGMMTGREIVEGSGRRFRVDGANLVARPGRDTCRNLQMKPAQGIARRHTDGGGELVDRLSDGPKRDPVGP